MSRGLPQLCTFSGQFVVRKRFEPDTYDKGRLSTGTFTLSESMPASVQTLSYKMTRGISQFTEGTRSSGWIIVYCEVNTFREGNDKKSLPSDVVIYEDEEYVVQKVDHRTGRRLRHDKVFAARED